MDAELPGYVLHEPLGEGAHATVWRAEPRGRPGRVVAVKRLRGRVDPAGLHALRREAEALERLSHPSILRLLEVVEDGDGLALVVPYAPGGSLAARLATAVQLPPVEVADLGARLAGALAAAHNAGLLHRDVKPANVLFDAEGQPLLADFGTARLLDEDRLAVAGTAEYLDPEVLHGPAGIASDLYGLAATLYEALAGVPPYAGSTPRATLRAADRGVHVPLPRVVDAPPILTDAVEAALARDPAARPATSSWLAGRLDEARRALQASEEVAPPDGPPADRGTPDGPPADRGTPDGPPADRGMFSGQLAVERPPEAPGPRQRSRTQRFGPIPPPAATTAPRRRGGLDRRLLIAAALAVVAVPLAIVGWLTWGGDGAPDADAPPIGGDDPAATHERIPPQRCDDVLEPAEAGTRDAEVHEADVDGRGCAVPVVWDGDLLLVPRPGELPERYDLDALAEDELVFGDWSCDGADTPALYRPSTGELFVFDGFAGADEELAGRVEDTRVTQGEPRVLTDEAGCDRLVVEPG